MDRQMGQDGSNAMLDFSAPMDDILLQFWNDRITTHEYIRVDIRTSLKLMVTELCDPFVNLC